MPTRDHTVFLTDPAENSAKGRCYKAVFAICLPDRHLLQLGYTNKQINIEVGTKLKFKLHRILIQYLKNFQFNVLKVKVMPVEGDNVPSLKPTGSTTQWEYKPLDSEDFFSLKVFKYLTVLWKISRFISICKSETSK